MKLIKINEGQYKNLFLLTEGAEANNEKAARDYLRTQRNLNDEKAIEFIGGVKHDIPNSRLAKSKFMLGVVRIVCEGGVVQEDIVKFNTLLAYIASNAHVNEYDRNLNGLSFNEINDRFSKVMLDDMEKEKQELSLIKYAPNGNYTIVPIKTHEEAKAYAEYTEWCVTREQSLYDTYTYGGIGTFYFCLKNGFEGVPKEVGENCPLDEYGLSMIAVSVTPEGAPNTITCRWNHEHKANDHIMTSKQLSILLGDSFYNLFPPKYTEQELRSLGYIPKDEALEILANNGDPNLCSKTISYLIRKEDKDIMKYIEEAYEYVDDNGDTDSFDSYSEARETGLDVDEMYHFYYIHLPGGKTMVNPIIQDEFGAETPGLDEWVESYFKTKYDNIVIAERKNGKKNIACISKSSKYILSKDADSIYEDNICIINKSKYGVIENFVFAATYDNKIALFSSDGSKLSDFYHYMRLDGSKYIVTNNDGKRNVIDLDGNVMMNFWCECIYEVPGRYFNKNKGGEYVKVTLPGVVEVNNLNYFVSPDGKNIIGDKNGYKIIRQNYYEKVKRGNVSVERKDVDAMYNVTLTDGRDAIVLYIDGKIITKPTGY